MRLRVGLVGAGHIGQFHARAVRGICRRELVDAEYVAVADLDRSRAEHFAAIANLTICSDDPATLLDDPSIDAIYICTPTRQHRELVLRAAAAGKAIFCEKPLAVDLSTARELASAVTEAGS